MAKGSAPKHQKSSSAERKTEEVDRISTLPNELLTHVLAFLETKEVVATSVLSSKWRSLWTLVPALDFKDANNCFSKTTFDHVVGNVLAQSKTESIKRLSLLSHHKRLAPNMVTLLVSIAVAKKLEELYLSYFCLEATLPSRLFTCETLSILHLYGNINWNLPSSIHLPLLKILHLYLVYFIDDKSVMSLLSGCPILEELFYREAEHINRSSAFGICVPSLKSLHVKSNDERLRIDTPMLEFLQLNETLATDYLVGNMDNLAEAYIDIYFDPYEDGKSENIPKLFIGIQKTRFLRLYHCATEVLTYACTEFQNLVHLQLFLSTLDSYFLVQLLLEKCPKLEILEIVKVDEEGEIEWTNPKTKIPSCLSSHLTQFIFREYGDTKEELELIGYILKSGQVLQTITIHIADGLSPKEIKKAVSKLCRLPRASKNCQTLYENVG